MGKQKQLKRQRRLQRLGNSIMQLIAGTPAMTAKYKELQELKNNGMFGTEEWHKKMRELSNMITFSLANQK